MDAMGVNAAGADFIGPTSGFHGFPGSTTRETAIPRKESCVQVLQISPQKSRLVEQEGMCNTQSCVREGKCM